MRDSDIGKSIYYKTWALFQKQDVTFFTLKDNVQDILIIFAVIALSYKCLQIMSECYGKVKST